MPAIPLWLQLLLGLFSILEPGLGWVVVAIKLAYEIWLVIPWFHKPGALIELQRAVVQAKVNKDPAPIHAFSAKWQAHLESGVGVLPNTKGLD